MANLAVVLILWAGAGRRCTPRCILSSPADLARMVDFALEQAPPADLEAPADRETIPEVDIWHFWKGMEAWVEAEARRAGFE